MVVFKSFVFINGYPNEQCQQAGRIRFLLWCSGDARVREDKGF